MFPPLWACWYGRVQMLQDPELVGVILQSATGVASDRSVVLWTVWRRIAKPAGGDQSGNSTGNLGRRSGEADEAGTRGVLRRIRSGIPADDRGDAAGRRFLHPERRDLPKLPPASQQSK